jgi:hypothetical protein
MNVPAFQRRHASGLVFLSLGALAAVLFVTGPLKSRIEVESKIEHLEQLAAGQRAIIASSSTSQGKLRALRQNAGFQEQLLQGKSLNMAITQAQGTLTDLVEDNGGKILRVANAKAGADKSVRGVVTSVHFECDDQSLNDILYAIEFGSVNFIIDRAEIRARRSSSRTRTAPPTDDGPADRLTVRLDVRGFWQENQSLED